VARVTPTAGAQFDPGQRLMRLVLGNVLVRQRSNKPPRRSNRSVSFDSHKFSLLVIAKTATIAKDRRNDWPTQTACATGFQFGFFGNSHLWKFLAFFINQTPRGGFAPPAACYKLAAYSGIFSPDFSFTYAFFQSGR